MRIAYITMQFPAPSETFTSNDVYTLNKLGNDVSVYSLKSKHKDHALMIKERKLQNIPIFSSGFIEGLLGIIEIFKSPFLFLSLFYWIVKNDINKPAHFFKMCALIPSSFYILKELRKKNINILHLFWGHYPSLVAFLVKKTMPNTKISLFLGAYDLEYSLGISKYISTISDFIFTHSNVNIEQLNDMQINTKDINVIHRGVNINYLLPLINKTIKKNNKWTSVGRLLESKGFDKVIDIFSFFNKDNVVSSLDIIGSGPIEGKLKLKINALSLDSNVSLKGHMAHDNVLQYMAESDIFILLSSKKGERLPNVIKEAMLARCICITSYTPGIEELIIDGVTGFIIKEENYNKIPNIISSLTDVEKEKIRNNAREYILNNFNVESSMKKYLKVWSKNK